MIQDLLNPSGRRIGRFASNDPSPEQQLRQQSLYDQVMETNRQWSQPQEAPSQSDMLMRQYRPPMQPQDFAAQMSGDVPVGLSMRKIARDPRWLDLYQKNPEAALQIYRDASGGVSPEEDALAENLGPSVRTLAQLRKYQQRQKEAKPFLSTIEGNYGINPSLMMEDLNEKTRTGYNRQTSTLHYRKGFEKDEYGKDTGTPHIEGLFIPPAAVDQTRDYMSAMHGFPSFQDMRFSDPEYVNEQMRGVQEAQQEQFDASGEGQRARKARFDELLKRRAPVAPQLIPDENAGYWGGM